METNAQTAIVSSDASILNDFSGGTSGSVEMMIGVGLMKESEAVFFQYVGEKQQPRALMVPTTGLPLRRLNNVRLTGISILEDFGEFKSTKLNLYLQSPSGYTMLVTAGLSTIWSQCVLTSLMGMYHSYDLTTPFTLDSWKGNSKMRPCFAGIRLNNQKVSDQLMYDQLQDARSDRDSVRVERILRSAVVTLNEALGGDVETVTVTDETEVNEQAAELF